MASELTILDLAVTAFLGGWLVLSVLRVSPSTFEALPATRLLTDYVPQWNFFAPIPGVHDYHILYRDITDEGFIGVWTEIDAFDETAAWRAGVWNPDKRTNKSIIDLVQQLLQDSGAIVNATDRGRGATERSGELVQDDALERLKLTIPYLHILQYVSRLEREGTAAATQFLVLRSSRESQPEVLFISDAHSI